MKKPQDTTDDSKNNLPAKAEPKELAQPSHLHVLQVQEVQFEQRMAVAVKSTTNKDWLDMGGEPYLCESGTAKLSLRFGIDLLLDRDQKEDVRFEKEEFTDELGPIIMYTVYGTAVIAGHPVPAIGTATTRDLFLGWIDYQAKSPKPIYEVIGNIKKKALTNFRRNAVMAALGMDGLGWEDLAKYGITREKKAGVSYGDKKTGRKSASTKRNEKQDAPAWEWDSDKGKKMCARTGTHFTEAFLKGLGFKKSRNSDTWLVDYSDAVVETLRAEYERVEGKE